MYRFAGSEMSWRVLMDGGDLVELTSFFLGIGAKQELEQRSDRSFEVWHDFGSSFGYSASIQNPTIEISPRDQMNLTIRKVGREQNDAIVIDGFFTDLDLVRRNVLLLKYRKPDYSDPGEISKPDWDFSPIEKLVSQPLGLNPQSKFIFPFSMVTLSGKDFHSGFIQEGRFGEEVDQRRLTLNFFVELN